MKITDMAIIFAFITVPFILILKLNIDSLESTLYKQIEINHILDTAVEDGIANLTEINNNNETIVNKDKAVQAFLKTLYINFNLYDSISQKRLMTYIPVIAVVDYDGYYIYSNEVYKGSDGGNRTTSVWKPKKHYTYEKDDYIYFFTLEDEVTIYDKKTGKFYNGKYQDVKKQVTSSILDDEQLFDQVRRRTIIELLIKDISVSINNNNKVAKHNGISYHFSLPAIDEAEWNKTIDDISMLVFFQGLPLGLNGHTYNNYALSGARIIKGAEYYAELNTTTNIKYYHKKDCTLITGNGEMISSKAQSAKKGYLPCNVCNP